MLSSFGGEELARSCLGDADNCQNPSLPVAVCPAIGWHASSPCLLWRWERLTANSRLRSPVPRSLSFLLLPKDDDNRIQLATQRDPRDIWRGRSGRNAEGSR